jgi:hypothetical protein
MGGRRWQSETCSVTRYDVEYISCGISYDMPAFFIVNNRDNHVVTRSPLLVCSGSALIQNMQVSDLDPCFQVKVKFFRYRPLGTRNVKASGFSRLSAQWRWVRSSPLRTGRLYPQQFSSYSFLEGESTPGRMVPSVASEKIPSDTTGDRFRDPSTSSAVRCMHVELHIAIFSDPTGVDPKLEAKW